MPSSYPHLRAGQTIVAPNGTPTQTFFKSINDAFREIGQQIGLIRAAQETATGAASIAASADAKADQAAADAAAATEAQAAIAAQLSAFSADGILSPMEKRPFMSLYSQITSEQGDMIAKANLYGIVAERDAYNAAITDLNAFLATQDSPFSWNNTAGNTNIDAATFETKFNAVPISKTVLSNAIAAKAKALADSASIGGNGNRVRYSLMESGTLGFASLFNPHNLNGVISPLNYEGFRYAQLSRQWSAPNQIFSLGTNYNDFAYRIPVRGGERIYAGARLAFDDATASGQTFEFVIGYFDQNGNGMAGGETLASGPFAGTANYGKFVTVPAGAFSAWFEVYARNNTSIGAYGTIFLAEPMVCSAGPLQTIPPRFVAGPGTEYGADVTSWISGVDATFQHDSQGDLQPGQARTLTFTLDGSNGSITAGVTWSWKIKTGQVNGVNASENESALNSDGGIGRVPISSLQTTSVIEIIATRSGQRKTRPFILTRAQAASSVTPPTTSGGSGPAPAGASKTDGWATLSSTIFVELGRLNMVASSGVNLSASINFYPDEAAPTNTNNISMKWQREVTIDSGTWEDVSAPTTGTTQIYTRLQPRSPYNEFEPEDPNSERVVTGTTIQNNASVAVTGVQRFRLVAAGSNSTQQYVYGTASANPQ